MINLEKIASLSKEGEIWKDVVGFEGVYMVSNQGRVLSLFKSKVRPYRILKPYTNNKGYKMVVFSVNNQRQQYSIHRLVAKAFIPNPENKSLVDHIDTVRDNNKVENLHWVDYSENRTNTMTLINRAHHKDYVDSPKIYESLDDFLHTHTMLNEKWCDVVGGKGMYMISSLGRVLSIDRPNSRGNKFLNGCCQDGYRFVNITLNGLQKTQPVHRLVAEAFILNPENKPEVDHINTIRDDNRLENLHWVTRLENAHNPTTLQHRRDNPMSGSKNPNFGKHFSEETREKLRKSHLGLQSGKNNAHSRPVKQFTLDGTFIKEYDCVADAKKSIGKGSSNIDVCARGKQHSCAGYIWKYSDLIH